MSYVQLTLKEYQVLLEASKGIENIIVSESTYTTNESVSVKVSKEAAEAFIKENYKNNNRRNIIIEQIDWVD